MVVFPNLKKSERPINRERNYRQEKPNARQRLDFFDPAKKRIDDKSKKQTEINAETARANGKGVIFDMKRALGNLVAKSAARGNPLSFWGQ